MTPRYLSKQPKFAQRIGEVVLKTVELTTAMYHLQDETTQESPRQAGPSQATTPSANKPIEESKTMDERSPKKSKKRKASQNFAMVAHNGKAVPNQPA